MRCIWIYIFSLLLCNSNLFAQVTESGEAFAKGIQAYQQKEYDKAIKEYEKALSGSSKSSAAYNNLGLAYYQQGDLGRAVLNLERALRYNPNNRDAVQNLKAVNQYIESTHNKVAPLWIVRTWNQIVASMNSTAWAWFFIVVCAILAGLIGLLYVFKIATNGKILYFALSFVAVLAFFSLIWGYQAQLQEFGKSYAVLLHQEAGIRTEAGLQGEEIVLVGAGTKFSILEETDEWVKVRLGNDIVGWMPKSMIERI